MPENSIFNEIFQNSEFYITIILRMTAAIFFAAMLGKRLIPVFNKRKV